MLFHVERADSPLRTVPAIRYTRDMPTPTDAMTPSEFAARIDHTILKPELDPADVDRVIEETEKYGFASACLPPTFVKVAAGRFRADKPDGTETIRSGGAVLGNPLVCTVVGFPHGTSKPTVKAIEATAAVKDGADEVDMVIFLPNLIAGDVNAARAEVQEVVRGARAARPDVVVKVIVESAALLASVRGKADPERMIADACRAVREGGADYIKTSTGDAGPGGDRARRMLPVDAFDRVCPGAGA